MSAVTDLQEYLRDGLLYNLHPSTIEMLKIVLMPIATQLDSCQRDDDFIDYYRNILPNHMEELRERIQEIDSIPDIKRQLINDLLNEFIGFDPYDESGQLTLPVSSSNYLLPWHSIAYANSEDLSNLLSEYNITIYVPVHINGTIHHMNLEKMLGLLTFEYLTNSDFNITVFGHKMRDKNSYLIRPQDITYIEFLNTGSTISSNALFPSIGMIGSPLSFRVPYYTIDIKNIGEISFLTFDFLEGFKMGAKSNDIHDYLSDLRLKKPTYNPSTEPFVPPEPNFNDDYKGIPLNF